MVLPLTYTEPDRMGLFLGDLVLVTPAGGERASTAFRSMSFA